MKLTIEQIDKELLKLIDEQPEFVYPTTNEKIDLESCYYNQGPANDISKCDGCIFGQAFQRLGIAKERLHSVAAIRMLKLNELPDEKARPKYWQKIQAAQDMGTPWGELKKLLPTIE